jgi:hypothetical protein
MTRYRLICAERLTSGIGPMQIFTPSLNLVLKDFAEVRRERFKCRLLWAGRGSGIPDSKRERCVQSGRPKRSVRPAWRRAVPMRDEMRSLSVANSG